MSGSPSERAIRDALVAHLRAVAPRGRIVHELVVGECRADIAVVEPERLILFEIKSERDTLDRLDRQMKTFAALSHGAVAVLHERWFDRTPYNDGKPRMAFDGAHGGFDVWSFPAPDLAVYRYASAYRWDTPRPSIRQPRAFDFLNLMWRDEMAVEAGRHRISCGPRANMAQMAEQMAYLMTGREIARAVCRQLRLRSFPEADAPISESAEVAA